MKKTLSIALLAIFSFVLNINAQSSQVATLNHEGTISVFYGSEAFTNAYAAAVHGDAITLSSGSFRATDLTKAVSIHGAGMRLDTLTSTAPTVLLGNFDINVPDTLSFSIEGIFHDGNIHLNSMFRTQLIKCRFYSIEYSYDTSVSKATKDVSFIHCRIANSIKSYGGNLSFYNCVIKDPTVHNDKPLSFTNCFLIIKIKSSLEKYSEYNNCVVWVSGGSSYTGGYSGGGETTSHNNNIFLVDNSLSSSLKVNNVAVKPSSFPELNGSYSENKTYVLPDNLKNLIKGTDGTEVGIYGGVMPYDEIPSNPRITKLTVDKKTSSDGKLNVMVEINGEK